MSFVDANVPVYSASAAAPFRDEAKNALRQFGAAERLCISRQVLRKYVAAMTREQSWGRALSLAEAMADSQLFVRQFTVLEDGPLVWAELLDLSRRFKFGGRQVHDANIVATMLAYRERRLLSFNVGNSRRFSGVIDVPALSHN